MPWYLRPAWLGGHLLVVAASLVMVRLGVWQWHVGGVRNGDLRNYAYALQWWAFVGFSVALWARVMRDRGGRPSVVRDQPVVSQRSSRPEAADGYSGATYLSYVMPQADGIAEGVEDDEARAYNAYLASLDHSKENR